jgi:uncharacterized protein YecE (DUF72 family)
VFIEARGAAAMARILIGACSWTDHAPFYPSSYDTARMRSQRISYYAQYFPLVEVDSTFYALQPERNFQLWADRTPEHFVFNVKAYGELTWHHRDDQKRPIAPGAETFERFSRMIQPLRAAGKLGAAHFQFPPWFTFSDDNIDYLATVREFLPDDRVAVEFRHRSWLEPDHREETFGALRDHGLSYVMVDEPQLGSGSVPPVLAVTDRQLAVVRFHGRNRKTWYIRDAASSADRFDYLYTRPELAEWKPRVEQIAEEASEIHLLTNNNRSNYALVNAFDLAELLQVPLPLPPPPAVAETMEQRDRGELGAGQAAEQR